MHGSTGFVLGLLTGLLAAVIAAASLMASFVASDLERFRAWLDELPEVP